MSVVGLPSAKERFNVEMEYRRLPWRLAEGWPAGWVLIVDPDAAEDGGWELLLLGDARNEVEAVARSRTWLRRTGRL